MVRGHLPGRPAPGFGGARRPGGARALSCPAFPMRFSRPDCDVFVPDGSSAEAALARTTHLCVMAHQDDIEILAYPAVAECFEEKDRHFTGVVVTNGSGSPRSGPFAGFSDAQMQAVRRDEQR